MTLRAVPALAALTATALTGAAFANPIDLVRPDAPELTAYGAFPIGVQTLTATIPDSIDVLNVTDADVPRYDRPLTLEVWYPAAPGTAQGGSYRAMLRDGVTEVTLTGRAARDAAPANGARFPLVVISHGLSRQSVLDEPSGRKSCVQRICDGVNRSHRQHLFRSGGIWINLAEPSAGSGVCGGLHGRPRGGHWGRSLTQATQVSSAIPWAATAR